MRRKYQTEQGLSRTSTGVISELKVASDLINLGYEVFLALDPHASCDLLAMKNKRIFRIQVRTGRLQNNKITVERRGDHDHLAVVVNNLIVYEPFLPCGTLSSRKVES